MRQIQTVCKSAGDYGCLFFCYCYIGGINLYKALSNITNLMDLKILDSEMTVNSAAKLYEYFGISADISISSTPPSDNSLYCAGYTNNGYKHWVVCRNGNVVFNSLDHSVCVEKGKATDFRVVHIHK